MSEKEKPNSDIPSAPLEENSSSNIIRQNISPQSYQQPSMQPVLSGSEPPFNYNMGLPQYSEPPPSYQAAAAYPSAMPYSVNLNDTTLPRISHNVTPYPLLSVPNQTLPPTTPPTLTSASSQAPAVAVSRREYCPYCGVGAISGETDLFCLICLVLLAVCTFPIGLLYLCLIPCTVHKRCSHCRRTG